MGSSMGSMMQQGILPGLLSSFGGGQSTGGGTPSMGGGATGQTGGMNLDMGGPTFASLMGTPAGAANAGSFMQQLPSLLQKSGQGMQGIPAGGAGGGQSRGMQDIGMGLQTLAQLLPFFMA